MEIILKINNPGQRDVICEFLTNKGAIIFTQDDPIFHTFDIAVRITTNGIKAIKELLTILEDSGNVNGLCSVLGYEFDEDEED